MVQTQDDVASATEPSTTGASVAEQAKQQAQQVAEQAREKATQATEQARGQIRSQIDQRTTDAGHKLSSTLGDIRTVGEQLRDQGKETPARLAEQVAERGERVASYLESADTDQLLGDVEEFARRNPWAVAAGGAILGFAASRFLKASSRQRSTRTALPPGYGSGMPAAGRSYGSGVSTPGVS